ncbi:MAG TPA: TIGR02996 domain-containing protein, partial [Gemmata sp.]
GRTNVPDAATFEPALRANPDDLITWCAYADGLAGQGDPRGEFMQVQLALEDETRSQKDRYILKKRERQLLAVHQREWLGALAPFAFDRDRDYRNVKIRFSRGWLAEVAGTSRSDWSAPSGTRQKRSS